MTGRRTAATRTVWKYSGSEATWQRMDVEMRVWTSARCWRAVREETSGSRQTAHSS